MECNVMATNHRDTMFYKTFFKSTRDAEFTILFIMNENVAQNGS